MKSIIFVRHLSGNLLSVVMLIICLSVLTVFAQTTLTKTFDPSRLPKDAPIVLSDSRLGERRIYKQMDFAEADWLKFLSLKIRNLTEKNIVYLGVRFNFPETKSSGLPMSYTTSLGTFETRRTPDKQLLIVGRNNAPLKLLPGVDADIKLVDEYTRLKKFIESRTPVSNINQVVLGLEKEVLDDGSQWERSYG